ncbi:MAG TPA: hypothetical protein VJ652_08125 [Noviherbaspirillum sp.]|nr:hypothetical protein [Noviherbaspirillum sp.]
MPRLTERIIFTALALVCIAGGILSGMLMLYDALVGSPRAWRLFRAFDRVGNAATGGTDTETISSRAHRARTEGRRWGCVLCRLLDYIERDHCKRSAGI